MILPGIMNEGHAVLATASCELGRVPPKPPTRVWRFAAADYPCERVHALRRLSCVESSRGLDLGKARFRSPFSSLVKLSLGTGIELLLAHNRRHVWLMREVMEQPGFPSA